MVSNAAASALSPAEQAARVVAVILNKVQNLEWYYFKVNLLEQFDVDLDDQHPKMGILSRIEDRRLEDRNSRYKWVGTEKEKGELLRCLLSVLRTNPEAGRQVFQRIFDLNEIPDPGVRKGMLGRANWFVRVRRTWTYRRSVRRGGSPVTIVAEGDSWFQYPFATDIIGHFMRNRAYRVLNLADGGDWLNTMLQSGQYVSELSRIQPEFFLFSGGGNDLTADSRISFAVKKPLEELKPIFEDLLKKREHNRECHPTFDHIHYESGLRCLTPEIFSLLNFVFLEYLLLLQNLFDPKLYGLSIITHGYDFMRPRKTFFRCWNPWRWFLNWWLGGRWLWVPMQEKGLEEDNKRDAIYVMVSEFNEMMIDLAKYSGHPRLFHVDCRGMAIRNKDWFDEIHLTSRAFKEVALVIQCCIKKAKENKEADRRKTQRVFIGLDYMNPHVPSLTRRTLMFIRELWIKSTHRRLRAKHSKPELEH